MDKDRVSKLGWLGIVHIVSAQESTVALMVKNLPAIWKTWVRSLGREDPRETVMAPHSSTLAWKIPWTEEPGRLQSMGSLRVGHDWATSLSLFTFMHWRRKWQPTPVFLPGKSQGRGSLVGCRLWGCRVGDDWSNSATAANSHLYYFYSYNSINIKAKILVFVRKCYLR